MDILSSKLPENNAIYKHLGKKKKKYLQHIYSIPTSHKHISWGFFYDYSLHSFLKNMSYIYKKQHQYFNLM